MDAQEARMLRAELAQTKQNFQEANQNYFRVLEEKMEVERQSELFLEKVKNQLTEKTSEFELLRDKFLPQDKGLLKLQLQEELELAHREKISCLNGEIEQLRENVHFLQREKAKKSSEFETLGESYRREIASIQSDHELVVKSLRDEISRIRDNDYLCDKDEESRLLKNKVHELEHQLSHARNEIIALTKQCDGLSCEKEEAKTLSENIIAHLKAKQLSSDAERIGAEQKLQIVNLDFDKKEALLRVLKQRVEDLSIELSHSQVHCRNALQQVSELTEEHNRIMDETISRHEIELCEATSEVEELNRKLIEREEILRKSQHEVAEMQNRVETMDSEVKRKYQLQLQEVTKQVASLKAGNYEVSTEQKLSELQKIKLQERYEVELESLRNEILPLRREKQSLHETILRLETKLEQSEKNCYHLRREMGLSGSSLSEIVAEAKRRSADLEAKLTAAEQLVLHSQQTIASLRRSVEESTEANNCLRTELQDVQEELSSIEKRHKEKLEIVKKEHSKALHHEKKRVDEYKEKAAEALRKGKAISDAALAASFAFGNKHRVPIQQVAPSNPVINFSSTANERPNIKMETQLDSWEKKCQAFDLELAKSRIREEDMTSSNAKLRNEVNILEEQRRRVNEKLNELENVKKALQAQLVQLEQVVRQEKDKCTDLEASKRTLLNQINTLESSLRRETEKVNQLEGEKKQLQTTVDSLEGSIRREVDRFSDAENGKKSAVAQVAKLESLLRRESEKVNSLESSKKQVDNELDSLNNSSRRDKDKIQELESSLKSANMELSRLEQALRRERDDVKQNDSIVSRLREEIEQYRSSNQALDSQYKVLQRKFDAERENFALLAELPRAKEELQKSQEKYLKLSNEHSILKQKVSEIQEAVRFNSSEFAQALQIEWNIATDTTDTFVQAIRSMRQLVTREEQLKASAITALEKLRLEFDSLQMKYLDLERKNLQSSSLQQEWHLKQVSMERDMQSLGVLQEAFDKLKMQSIEIQDARNRLKIQNESLEAEISRLESDNRDLRHQLSIVTPQLQSLRYEMGILEEIVVNENRRNAEETIRNYQQQTSHSLRSSHSQPISYHHTHRGDDLNRYPTELPSTLTTVSARPTSGTNAGTAGGGVGVSTGMSGLGRFSFPGSRMSQDSLSPRNNNYNSRSNFSPRSDTSGNKYGDEGNRSPQFRVGESSEDIPLPRLSMPLPSQLSPK